MEELLKVLLPRVLCGCKFEIHVFQGKHDLLSKLPERLRAYRKYRQPGYRMVVIVDRDNDDCQQLKQHMEVTAQSACLTTRSQCPDDWHVVNRIVVEELEAWYFGDWEAVRAAYPRVSQKIPRHHKYRNPDGIRGGTWEQFQKILQNAGYFKGGLEKMEAARSIAGHMDPRRNRSASFRAFYRVLQQLGGP